MAQLLVIILCSVICFAVSCSLPQRQDVKIVKPFHDATGLCTNNSIIYARSRKLFCLICKGLDPTCFGITTTTTSTTSTTTSTTPASTTTRSTTIPASTTSSTTPKTTTAESTE
ncbi:integumentary mucin C.1-like [Pararge aegeria]|uniref:integumentary mucin C.1-like n=1 Tax=Pararge aegeria TaxID=116150 RepID=UPI0019CF56E6|nr:integumentary mucin C.1-like [Pararge aegeria]